MNWDWHLFLLTMGFFVKKQKDIVPIHISSSSIVSKCFIILFHTIFKAIISILWKKMKETKHELVCGCIKKVFKDSHIGWMIYICLQLEIIEEFVFLFIVNIWPINKLFDFFFDGYKFSFLSFWVFKCWNLLLPHSINVNW